MFPHLIHQFALLSYSLKQWEKKAVLEIEQTLIKENFPCIFARRANDLKEMIFLFIDQSEYDSDSIENQYSKLFLGLLEYTNFCLNTPAKNAYTTHSL